MVMGALERLRPARTLGDITLMARLGEGGMATVYLGLMGEGPLARIAAVKLLRSDLPDHDYRTRFLDEAKVVVKLHHNNLVDVRAAGEHEGQLYIAMEAVEGRDLADIWDRCAEIGRAFPVELAVYIVREVLRGLHYAHTLPGLSLVHRDISPSNVLIDWAGAVRLADFGLATSTLKAANTVPGVVFGKVGYMSPEQALREALDGRADVYACGVVLWELITGRPLRAHDQLDTDVVARFQAPPPSTLSKRVDPELDRIVVQALDRDRDRRFESAKAMLERLNAWLAAHAPATSQETVSEFMNELFGGTREQERGTRDAMLRELSREIQARGGATPSPGASQTGTKLFGARVGTDPMDEEARSTKSAEALPAKRPPTLDELEHIPAGSVIAERYRVLSRLGRGGMGTVYLGEHLTVGRSVAIKVLTHEWSRHEGVAARFRAEARAASAAGHPNIVEVFDAGELPDGRLYLVMEFLTGRNLYEEIQVSGPMDVARACRISRSVARAVRAAHEVGIIHRDLKPDNVMLTSHGEDGDGEFVKVLDFGISASVAGEQTERLTVAGQALGTPEYMAPEQALGREATELFDMYALGVMFFEMLCGAPPFSGGNAIEIMSRKTIEPAPGLAQQRADLPDKLVQLVDECLQIDPARRPSSARVFLARVEEVLRGLPRGSAAVEVREAKQTDARRASARQGSALVWAVGGVVAAAAAAVGFWWVSSQGETAASERVTVQGAESPNLGVADATAAADPPEDETDAGESGAVGEAGDADPEGTQTGPGTPDAAVPVEVAPVQPAPQPAADPPSPPRPEAAGAEAAGPETALCKRARQRAKEARTAAEWPAVLRHTAKSGCWDDATERTALRAKAFSELNRWDECVKAGAGSSAAKVKKLVAFCRARAEREEAG